MAKYIECEALLKSDNWQSLKSDFDKARAHIIILGQPAADVVEVVRCKDCAFRGDMFDCECWHSPVGEAGLFTDDDFYCSCGVRRSDNE